MALTKEEKVLRHIQDYGTLNCIEAFGHYSITQLHGIIHHLKRKGYEFVNKQITVTNRYGEKHRIAEYSLKEN